MSGVLNLEQLTSSHSLYFERHALVVMYVRLSALDWKRYQDDRETDPGWFCLPVLERRPPRAKKDRRLRKLECPSPGAIAWERD